MTTTSPTNQTDIINRDNTVKPILVDSPVVLTVVSNWLMGDRVMAFVGMHDYDFAYISLGKGTVRKAYLRERGLTDLKKEIVTILTTLKSAYEILEDLKLEMHLEEANAGIAFMRRAVEDMEFETEIEEGTGEDEMEMQTQNQVDFRAIYIVVKKGFAENVISVGERVGTRGATVIPARGEAIRGGITGLKIADDKEVILIITNQEKSISLIREIKEDTELMTAGQVKLYVTEIIDTLGINYF